MNRLIQLFDEGCCHETDAACGENASIAFGTIGGSNVCAFSLSGALDLAAAAKLKKIYRLAETTGCPLVGIYDSNGVELAEGFSVLSAYGELVKHAARLSGVVPQISIVDGACLGLTAAMANTADTVVAVKESDFYVAVPSEKTVEESSNDGAVDCLCDTFEEAADTVQTLLSLLPENNLSAPPVFEFEDKAEQAADDVLSLISDQIVSVKLKKDYAPEVTAMLTTVGGSPAGLVVFHGAALTVNAAQKAAALVRLCDAYQLPVITVADSSGLQKENESCLLSAVTELLSVYASATCPKISLITSCSSGAAYVLLAGKGANADITLAWDSAVASPMPPESAVAFLWHDRLAAGENRDALVKEYEATLGSVATAAKDGAIDEVFPKEQTREKITQYLNLLASKRETTIPRKHSVK